MAVDGTRTKGGSVSSAARTMRATRGRARRFWRVFDKSLVPMVTVDNDRRDVAANRAARLLFRLSLAEMRRRQIYASLPPGERTSTPHSALHWSRPKARTGVRY